jgi:hypothetical protein
MVSSRIIVAIGLSACLVAILGIEIVSAQSQELTVLSQSVESQFPDSISFKLSASGPNPIEDIRVVLKTLGGEASTYGRIEVIPGNKVSGEYLLSTSTGAQYIPPGTLIRYYFELRDNAGGVLRTQQKEYLYEDNRFDWREVSQDNITVYYYGGEIAEFLKIRAEVVLEASLKAATKMEPVLGIITEEPIRLVLYSNYRDMTAALPFRSLAVSQDLVTQGQAWPNERVVLVLGTDSTVAGIASHELTHILVADAAGKGYRLVPAWLNEGLAEYGNIDQSDSYTQALITGIYTRKVRPLGYLTDFGGKPEDIVIAYGQSRSVISYLIAFYGEEKMAELMNAIEMLLPVDEALMGTYGFDQHGLDSEWRVAIGLDPFPEPGELEAAFNEAPVPASAPAPESNDQLLEAPATLEERGRRSGFGCGGSTNNAANIPLGLPLFALFTLPIFLRPLVRRIGIKDD